MDDDDERCTRRNTMKNIVRFLKNREALDDGVKKGHVNLLDDINDVIKHDPAFPGSACAAVVMRPLSHKPFVVIIEQPAHVYRFRYKCECDHRSPGSIPGKSSTRQNKTYPRIKIGNYVGKAIILISLVSKDLPYRAHPHNLVGRDCSQGVSAVQLTFTEEVCEYQAMNLGIEFTKRHDVAESLAVRQKLRIDPFRNKFHHKDHPGSVSLKAVRLCFHVFIPDDEGRLRRPLTPVVSDIINHKKVINDKLLIESSNVCSGTALGGTKVYLLCENVAQKGVQVIFYQENNRVKVWREMATEIRVHKQATIVFRTPAYKLSNITQNVQVYYQVQRLSDNALSKPMPFEYIPNFAETSNKQRKVVSDMLRHYTQENWSPLHYNNISSSPLHAPQHQQIWGLDNMIGSLSVPGPSYLEQNMSSSNPEGVMVDEMSASQPYGQVSPLYMQTPDMDQYMQMSQSMQSMSPNMQSMSPSMQAPSTKTKNISLELQLLSSNQQLLSRKKKHISPELQLLSSYLESVSPTMKQMNNVTDYIRPNMEVLSPQEETMSSEMQVMSPRDQMWENLQPLSPNVEEIDVTTDSIWPEMVYLSPPREDNSPNMQVMSPMDEISPNMQPLPPNIQQTYGTTEHMSEHDA